MTPDDPSIDDGTVLYRRLHPTEVVWDHTEGRLRPTRAAFKGDEMSIHLGDDMEREGLDLDFPLLGRPSHHLCNFDAGFARSLDQTVSREHLDEDPTHGNVNGPKPKSVRGRFAKAAELVVLRVEGLKPEHRRLYEELAGAEEADAA